MINKLEVLDKNLVPIGKLVNAYEETRKRRINSDYEMSFLVPMISDDYRELIQLKGHIEDERGQIYVIQSRSRVRDGRKLTASIYCNHVMFKLMDYKFPYSSYISESYGTHISQLTDLISAATGGRFTFSIDDTFDLVDVKDFGQGNCLVALNKVIELYGCEIDPENFVIHMKKKIGGDYGHQYRLKKNIVSDQFKDDVSSLVTRMFAQMKDGTTWIGQPASIFTADERALLEAVPGAIEDGILKVNYLISPYVHTWSSDSVPFYDGEIIEQDIDPEIDLVAAVQALLEATRKALREQEIPAFEVTVDGADLYKIDGEETKPGLGDIVYCHDPDMEMVNLEARITELTEYPYSMDKHALATVANVMQRDERDIQSDLEKSKNTVQNLFSGGRIRAAAFEEFAKQAVHDINNSKTELIYPPEGGILAQDKTDPLRQVRLTAAGLGVSTDGWNTLRAAITADGVMGEMIRGQIGGFESLSVGHDDEIILLNHTGLAAGNAEFDDAPFRVDMQGNVVARKITLTGLIEDSTVEYTDIVAGTITGAMIQTATADRKIILDETGFRSFDGSGTRRISIDTDDNFGTQEMRYYGADGSKSGVVSGSNGQLNIAATPPNNLVLAGRNIVLGGDANVEDFPMTLAVALGSGVGTFDFNYATIANCSEIDQLNARVAALESALAGKASISHSHTVNLGTHNHGITGASNWGGTFSVS